MNQPASALSAKAGFSSCAGTASGGEHLFWDDRDHAHVPVDDEVGLEAADSYPFVGFRGEHFESDAHLVLDQAYALDLDLDPAVEGGDP